jgi:hypothetical protein
MGVSEANVTGDLDQPASRVSQCFFGGSHQSASDPLPLLWGVHHERRGAADKFRPVQHYHAAEGCEARQCAGRL